jgi:hypothetical protein
MRRQTFAALAVVPILALGLTACGGGKDPVTKAAASKSSDLDAMRKFAQCMRQNGVDMPDPSDDGGAIEMRSSAKPGGESQVQAAEAKCRHFQPNGGKPVKLKPEDLARMRAMAKCMREHGVDMPDPDENGRITIKRKAGDGPGMNPDSPTFKAANKACRQYAPGHPGQQGTSSGGGS